MKIKNIYLKSINDEHQTSDEPILINFEVNQNNIDTKTINNSFIDITGYTHFIDSSEYNRAVSDFFNNWRKQINKQ